MPDLVAAARQPVSPIRAPAKGAGNPAPTDAVFTINDLVAYLKLPKSTVFTLAPEGKIPAQEVGERGRLHRLTTEPWLANCSTTTTGAVSPTTGTNGQS